MRSSQFQKKQELEGITGACGKRKHPALLLSCNTFPEERKASGEGLLQTREQKVKNVRRKNKQKTWDIWN